jgi:RNA polymerase sigma-70 factor (ECF subfamily)
MDSTPASLLERLRRPDEEAAWARFVELYTPLLYYWARRSGLQRGDAADLVQDVFVVLVRKLPEFTYDRQRSFRGWLHAVTLNKLRELLRRQDRQPAAAGSAIEEALAQDDRPALEEAEYRGHLVREALRVLRPEFPELTWKAFQEYAIDGRPPAEVAARLHLRVGTVYAAKSRVLARVRQELDGLLS